MIAQPVSHEDLQKIKGRARTEVILRAGDPFYEGPEAGAYDKLVTPDVVLGLCNEVQRLRVALAGHLFPGEAVSMREAIRSELIVAGLEALDHAVKQGLIIEAVRAFLAEAITKDELAHIYSARTVVEQLRAALDGTPAQTPQERAQ